jgi:hypothetical protein
MNSAEKIRENSDSLIGLLAAQCADLEALFSLAQKETAAAEQRDFESILHIVTERGRIGEKLEVYQRQTSELREFLNANETSQITRRITELAEKTIAQDSKTKMLLTSARDETALELRNLATGKRSVTGYLQETRKGLSFSESI